MRTSIGQPHEAPTTRTIASRRASPAECERAHAASVAAVWRSALASFVLRAPAILLVACVCVAGPAVLGLPINTALGLDRFVHIGGPFSTWEAIITLQNKGGSVWGVALVVQIGLGAVGLAFARGVIARLALSVSDGDAEYAPSLAAACRETKARFPSLLVGALLYGACLTAGAVGINAALRDTDLDLRLVGRRDVSTPAQALALRALDAFVPSPGSPFAEFVPLLRRSSFAETARFDNTSRSSTDNRHWAYIYDQVQGPSAHASTSTGTSDTPVFAISLASLGVLLLTEALLRFTPIMAMDACGRTRLNAITLVLRSIGFGIRHFGAITVHVWLLRLAFVVSYSVFFLLPIMLSQDVAPPIVRSMTRSVLGSWSVLPTLVCHTLITALVVAFSTVYDARLAARLDRRVSSR